MSNLQNEREIAKYFAMSSVNLRPDACQILYQNTQNMVYSDEKRNFLNKFIKYFKEWQTLNQKSSQMNNNFDNNLLDAKIAVKILSSINQNENKSSLLENQNENETMVP